MDDPNGLSSLFKALKGSMKLKSRTCFSHTVCGGTFCTCIKNEPVRYTKYIPLYKQTEEKSELLIWIYLQSMWSLKGFPLHLYLKTIQLESLDPVNSLPPIFVCP